MRFLGLWVIAGFAALGGCALFYNYSDYRDQGAATGGGGTNVGGSTSNSGSGGSTSSGGGVGGAGGVGGVAGGQPCLVTEACPATSNECAPLVCQGGTCATYYPSNGTPIASQTPYDCKINVCDGSGVVVSQKDDSDLPDDGNECTLDECNEMVPSNPFMMSGTDCGDPGQNMICDGAGTCIGCTSNASCTPLTPSGNALCKTWTCDASAHCQIANDPTNPQCGPSTPSCVDGLTRSYLESQQCSNGLCLAQQTSCQGYTCANQTSCNAFCTDPGGPLCAPGFACDIADCKPCTTCAQWASPPINFEPTTILCPDSETFRQSLVNCACMNNACAAQCPPTRLCGGLAPLTTDCTSCAFIECLAEILNCQATAVPVPVPVPVPM